jgi:glycosidase
VNVALQARDPASLLACYRALLQLRRRSPALRLGDLRWLSPRDPGASRQTLAYVRELEGERKLVLLNFLDAPDRVELDLPDARRVAFGTHRTAGACLEPGPITLQPFEVLIAELGG